ncbi:MAG: GNAT family N-acetyltransferase [Ferruginibacter sp.]|nr:GNAT family N-acetyltransferase [Ferruginibacter sp.]
MSQTLNITTLAEEDIEPLINLVNSAYRGESSKTGWTTEADLLDGLRTNQHSVKALMQKTGSVIFSATDETGLMVGCVHLQQNEQQLYLGMLTVAPDLQARGIGKQLLEAAEKYGRKINCTFIIMTVIDIRHELIDWYKRKGYQSTGETRPFSTDPAFGIPKQRLRFIVLEKKL